MKNRFLVSLIVALTALLSVPILTIGISFFLPSGDSLNHIFSTVLGTYISNSIILILGVGIGVSIIGLSLAWIVAMYDFPGKRFFEWGLLLPMAMPAYIVAYSYTSILEYGGPVQSVLGDILGTSNQILPPIRSLSGAIFVFTLVLYPYLYMICRTSFMQQSSTFFELSRSLGYSPRQTFFKLSLPLVRPAFIGGLSLVLMETLADFGTVQYFGIPTFTTGIYRTWFGLDNGIAAAQLSGFLLIFVFSILGFERLNRHKAKFHHTSQKIQYRKPEKLTGWSSISATAFCTFILVLACLIPFSQLIIGTILTWETSVDSRFFGLIVNSFGLAMSGALLIAVVALLFIYGQRFLKSKIISSCFFVISSGYALPGTVVAVGLLLPMIWIDNRIIDQVKSQGFDSPGMLVSGSILILLLAYLTKFLYLALQSIQSSYSKIRTSFDEVSRSLGYRPSEILKLVHLPMIKNGILTAMILVFVDILKELPATLILRPFNFNTLAVRTYELASDERLWESSASALMIVLVGIIPVYLLNRSIRSASESP